MCECVRAGAGAHVRACVYVCDYIGGRGGEGEKKRCNVACRVCVCVRACARACMHREDAY